MKSIKNFFAVTFGVLGAIVLAPFVAFFGLMMLGLAFGLSLIAAGAVTTMARKAQEAEDAEVTQTQAPEASHTAEAQPA